MNDRRGSKAALLGTDHLPGALRRFLVRQVGRILMGSLVVGALVVLSRLAPDVTNQAYDQEPPVNVEAMRVVGSEVRHIWLPQTLIELTKGDSLARFPETHAELRQVLKHQNLEKVWYALTLRGHHAGGGFSDATVVRHPYDESLFLAELSAVLETAAGHPPTYPESDFSTATVQIITKEISERAPLEAMAELVGQPRSEPTSP